MLIDINATLSTPTYLACSKVSAVPVPGSLLLLAPGLLGLARRSLFSTWQAASAFWLISSGVGLLARRRFR